MSPSLGVSILAACLTYTKPKSRIAIGKSETISDDCVSIRDCEFHSVGNEEIGGCICIRRPGIHCTIEDSKFITCRTRVDAGAVFLKTEKNEISSSLFDSCSAMTGQSAIIEANEQDIKSSSFSKSVKAPNAAEQHANLLIHTGNQHLSLLNFTKNSIGAQIPAFENSMPDSVQASFINFVGNDAEFGRIVYLYGQMTREASYFSLNFQSNIVRYTEEATFSVFNADVVIKDSEFFGNTGGYQFQVVADIGSITLIKCTMDSFTFAGGVVTKECKVING